jgi:hypothetical protein
MFILFIYLLPIYPTSAALGPTHPPKQWVPGLFPAGKAAGTWRLQPTQSSAEVKERDELYLYFFSGPSWPVLGRTLPFIAPIEV